MHFYGLILVGFRIEAKGGEKNPMDIWDILKKILIYGSVMFTVYVLLMHQFRTR